MDIPFHRPSITGEEIEEVLDTLRSGWLTTGPKTKLFEAEFAKYVGARNAIAVNSCTAALHLALEAIGLKAGDEVITTPMTFAATAEVIRYFQARPVFVDIEGSTINIDVSLLAEKVRELRKQGSPLKAVVPVHFGGLPCDMDPIMDIASTEGLKVIEDAAHILPATYKTRNIGTIGDMTCFSFYATKTITTGEGGMITTDSDSYAERARVMSLHGISKDAWKRYSAEGSWYYEIIAPGFKYNLTDMAAALGLAQLRRADIFQARREQIAARYSEAFALLPQIATPAAGENVKHSWHLYVIRLNLERLLIDRARFIEELKARGIGTSVHFIPLHLHPYYREAYGYKAEDFPVSFDVYQRTISLPIYPSMKDVEVDRVIEAVTEIAKLNES